MAPKVAKSDRFFPAVEAGCFPHISHQKNPHMFEQTVKNIDDILHKDAGCTSELPWARIGESGIITVV